MAILVNYCEVYPSRIRSKAYDNGFDKFHTSWQRADAMDKYNNSPYYGIPTRPVTWDKERKEEYGLPLYTLGGLLHTLFCYCEIDSDRSNGITSIHQIARVKSEIYSKNSRLEQKVSFPTGPRILFVEPDPSGLLTHRDITKQISNLAKSNHPNYAFMWGYLNSTGIHGLIHINLIDADLGSLSLARIGIEAANIPHFGDDSDEVMSIMHNNL